MPRRTRVRDQRQSSKKSDRRWLSIGLIALGAVIIVALLIYFNQPAQTTDPATTNTKFTPVPQANGMSMGNPEAAVKVEEYSDFQCPYCKAYFTDLEPTVIETYIKTGKVYFTYSPFSFIGQESVLAAQAAYCAADQNKFWEMHYQIFSAQGAENSGIFNTTSLNKMGAQAGLDLPKFRDCLSGGSKKQAVDDANTVAIGKKVESTPSFFVNGKGPFMMNQLTAEIDKALAGK